MSDTSNTICIFGVVRSFDYNQIGGTDSYFRRIALTLAQRNRNMEFVHYGCDQDEHDTPLPNLSIYRYRTLESALTHLSERQPIVVVNAVRAKDRLRFMRFRFQHRKTLSIFITLSLYPEALVKRLRYLLELRLYPYTDGAICMSSRIATTVRTWRQSTTPLLPPVPTAMYLSPTQKPAGNRFSVRYIGRLERGKGAEEAIAIMEAISHRHDIDLNIVGYMFDGDTHAVELEKKLIKHPAITYTRAEHAYWSPELEAELANTLKETDILLLPYRRLSSSIDTPLLLTEGMASLCCIVTPQLGDIPSLYGTSPFLLALETLTQDAISLLGNITRADITTERERLYQRVRQLDFDSDTTSEKFLTIVDPQSAPDSELEPNPQTPELAQFLHAIFDALNASEHSYCVLRNHEELPHYTSHDVDILVTPTGLEPTMSRIRQVAKCEQWSVAATNRQLDYSAITFYHSSDTLTQFLTIDLVCTLPWRSIETCNHTHVIQASHFHNGIRVAAPGCDAGMRLIKVLIRNQRLPFSSRKAIHELGSSDVDNLRTTFHRTLPSKDITTICTYTSQKRVEQLWASVGHFRRALIGQSLRTKPKHLLPRFLAYVRHQIREELTNGYGLFVVVIGPDGSGKSALCRHIRSRLHAHPFRGIRRYHHEFGILPRLRKVIRPRTTNDRDFTTRHSGSDLSPQSPLRILLYLCYYTWDYALGRFKLSRHRRLKQLALFDRYFYDYYFERRSMRMPRWILNIFGLLVPRPDLVILAQAPPEHVYARKNELSIEELERQFTQARALMDRLESKTRTLILDTSQPTSLSGEQAVAEIADILAQRRSGP